MALKWGIGFFPPSVRRKILSYGKEMQNITLHVLLAHLGENSESK
jgi:hypothetical protein